MAKVTGLGMTALNLDDSTGTPQDIRNDVTNFDFSTPYATQDVTGVDKSATERLALLSDHTGTLTGVFNPTTNRIVPVLTGDLRVVRTLAMTMATKSLASEVLVTDMGVNRAAGGELTVTAPYVLADGTVPTWV